MNAPDVTIYIPSHNYGRFLQDAIESVLRQTLDRWELLIINDNSTDNTDEIMTRYQGDERVRLFRTDGIGLPAVCNLALRESKGKYLIRLDGDDIFEENILLVLHNYLLRNPECAMVFPDYFLMDEFGQIYARQMREKLYTNNHVLDIPANGACCLIQKKVLQDLGGYREDLGVQDGFDLWVRLRERYKVANVNLPLFYYRRHGQNLTNNTCHIAVARQRIATDRISEKIDYFRPIIAVIPTRKNYDFCLDLWSRKIQGRSLLEWDIEKCTKIQLFDHIVVASDNPAVHDVIALFDDPRLSFYKRRTENTISSLGFVSTLEKLITPLDPDLKGLSVISYLQAPFITEKSKEETICTLILNDVDSAIGVEEVKEQLFKRTPYGLQAVNPPRGVSTDFDVIYRESNTVLVTKNKNQRTGTIRGPSTINYIVPTDECFFINSEQRLKIAQGLMQNK